MGGVTEHRKKNSVEKNGKVGRKSEEERWRVCQLTMANW